MPEETPEKEEVKSLEVTLDSIQKECMDAPGYVIFAAILTNERDEKGKSIIKYNYKRYQFSYEDTRNSIDELIKFFRKDVQTL